MATRSTVITALIQGLVEGRHPGEILEELEEEDDHEHGPQCYPAGQHLHGDAICVGCGSNNPTVLVRQVRTCGEVKDPQPCCDDCFRKVVRVTGLNEQDQHLIKALCQMCVPNKKQRIRRRRRNDSEETPKVEPPKTLWLCDDHNSHYNSVNKNP